MSPYEARLFTSAERLERTAGGGLWRKKKGLTLFSGWGLEESQQIMKRKKKSPCDVFFSSFFFFQADGSIQRAALVCSRPLSLPCTGGWRCRFLILSLLGRCVCGGGERGCWPRPSPSPVITAQMGEGGRHPGILGKRSPPGVHQGVEAGRPAGLLDEQLV